MSEYGIKIKNYQAANIYGYNLQIRDRLESTDAMLVNSLFLDFLKENGLNIYKGESTRDVICLEFGYGSPTYEEDIKKHKVSIKKIMNDTKLTDEEKADKLFIHTTLIEKAEESKDLYCGKKKDELRILYYTQGVDINYRTYNKKGICIKEETIHYKMLYRTPGKAKKGTCMFICDRLYNKAHEFLYMGLKLPKHNSPIVEIGAYASLITSSCIGKVQIKPEQMLIVKDLPTNIGTSAVLVKTNENKQCYVERVDEYDLGGEAFDGQALIDHTIFPDILDNGEKTNGYILLRHHMTKCAAFNTNIIQFLKDQYGDDYETATVKDMWGRDVNVRDIRFITTNNAIKWLKFGVSFDYWCDWISKNDYKFGIVKTTHKSKFGDVQRMSYQMTNSLDIDSMPNVVSKSVEYIENLKSNDEGYFLQYLKENTNFSNDYDVLLALVEHNPEFVRCEYYRDRKRRIIDAYVLDFKGGRTRQNADNLTIVGSPYGMLLHAIGKDARTDPTFKLEVDSIQCWCSKFDDGEYLAEFRSPFNSRNNLGYIHNVYHEYWDKYFKLGKLCIAVNTIDTDWQARNNGADQDSDSCYTTNQPDIVSHAKYCYQHYPTVVNEIQPEKNIYDLSLENYAKIDNNLTSCQMAIGQSSNLAQLALTYTYNFKDQKYDDYVCILAVLAQVAIDNSKRRFNVDLDKEIPRIKKDMNIEENGLPQFWLITKKDKRKASSDKERIRRQRENKEKIKKKINKELQCPMNYLYDINLKYEKNQESTLEMNYFFNKIDPGVDRRKSKKVEELIEKYSFDLHNFYLDHNGVNWEDDKEDYILLKSDFEELIKDIQKVYISRNYQGMMAWLINRAFCIGAGAKRNEEKMKSKTDKNKALLMKVLYSVNPEVFLKCFKKA